MMKVGLVGCGNISRIYLSNAKRFREQFAITQCADIRTEAAERTGSEFGLKASKVEEMLADPEIGIVLNLTTPQNHAEIDIAALKAGKHVYSEKPFAVTREEGRIILDLAEKKNLRAGCAPDTFLGGAHQTCRKLLDSGLIGNVSNGMAVMLCAGHESWHPAPGFYYQKGGGPLFDMGPYYITLLVNLLGAVDSVCAFANRKTELREGSNCNTGKTYPVEVDTHTSALLRFRSGAVVSLVTSFDVFAHSCGFNIELQGTRGALHIPDPNNFGGEIKFFQNGLTSTWATAANDLPYNDNSRGLGLADMVDAIEHNRPHRANAKNAFHVLEIICAVNESAQTGNVVKIVSDAVRAEPFFEHF